jgi:predicted Zn-dependent protease
MAQSGAMKTLRSLIAVVLVAVALPAAAADKQVDPALAKRLQMVMTPLLQHMDHPVPLDQVHISLVDDDHINAANSGGGEFLVTTGLLRKANDNQLRAIMAHEAAHADLGHVSQQETINAGLSIGIMLLDHIWPGSSQLTPLAGNFIQAHYSQKDEYQADAHGVEILRRAGYDGKNEMADTLAWLGKVESTEGGGFFDTHPATGDRVQAVRNLP